MGLFDGKKALIFGVANDRSIAWGIAQALHREGCELGFSYGAPPLEKRVRPLAESVGATFIEECNVADDTAIKHVFKKVEEDMGNIDVLVHSIAFAPKEDLQGCLVDCSAEGFATAMDISCHSFIRMARLAEPLMKEGGTLFAMTFHGAQQVVAGYNLMGPVKAALEAACRYLASELGHKHIRVHAISPGPLQTRAASGLKDFDRLLDEAARRAPLEELVDILDVGRLCAYLAGPAGRRITGDTIYVDAGAHIMA